MPVIRLETFEDERGKLTAVERVPFDIKRVFWLHDIKERRGGHAHKRCHQLIVCLYGKAHVVTDEWDGWLLNPSVGLHVPPGDFVEIDARDAVILVLCSEYFDEKDYVHAG
jgi:dTDP-4-dehydrorhamnose 3,5-epimerase-like enzyme